VRGGDNRTGELFSYVDLEARVRRDHPLRAIRVIVNEALSALEREFAALYSPIGRPSIAPEKLLRAMLLQAFYSIRSERLLMERLEYDLLFRWFVGIGVDDAAWDHSVFSKNRDRLLEGDIAAKFLAAMLAQPKVKKLLSSDHFSVDGTLIEAWASMKSVKPKDGSGEPPAQGGGRNAEADFHGQKRSNDTHASTTDPDARLYRKGKGKETKLCFIGHGLMENRHGLLVDACLTLADGHAERVAALHMIEPRADRPTAITLGADKAYDAEDFVNELRSMKVTPMWRRTPAAAALRSTGARPGTAVTPLVSASVNASRRRSAGSRQSPDNERPGSAAAIASDGPLPSRPPPTIWCGCRNSWRRSADGQGSRLRQGFYRPLAHRRDGRLGKRLPRPGRRSASHLPGQVRWRNCLRRSQGLPGRTLRHPRRFGLRGVLMGRARRE
jgi:transposase